jgi:hypothetical protein
MNKSTQATITMELGACDLFAIYGGLSMYLSGMAPEDVRKAIGKTQQKVCMAICACDAASETLRSDAGRQLVKLDKWLGVAP